jgi:2,3-bisphosphoglycerate-dependent phosphoglycerate mutase
MACNKVNLLCVLFCSLALPLSATSVYLVRHAEKQQGADPALTACGVARAEALASDLAGVKLSAVYATPYQRTQQTAAIIAKSQQLGVQTYDPRQADTLVDKITAQPQPVLIVGHSNTVPQLVTQLSGIAMAELNEQDYSMLYQVITADISSVMLTRQAFHCTE